MVPYILEGSTQRKIEPDSGSDCVGACAQLRSGKLVTHHWLRTYRAALVTVLLVGAMH